MDQQVSPAVVIIVLILIVAILVGLYFLVVERESQGGEGEPGVDVGPLDEGAPPQDTEATEDTGGAGETEAESDAEGDQADQAESETETEADADGDAEGSSSESDAGESAEQ